jgi:hypothetical protein
MGLLTLFKKRIGIVKIEEPIDKREVEPIHKPSFSIGDSLGDIKVGLKDVRDRIIRMEGTMLYRDYFDESITKLDKSELIIGKLEELYDALRSSTRKPSLEPSLTEEAEDHVRKAIDSLRLRQVLTIFNTRKRTTPKQLGQLLSIKNNTATEHLRKLEKLGYVRRVSRGLYEKV